MKSTHRKRNIASVREEAVVQRRNEGSRKGRIAQNSEQKRALKRSWILTAATVAALAALVLGFALRHVAFRSWNNQTGMYLSENILWQ